MRIFSPKQALRPITARFLKEPLQLVYTDVNKEVMPTDSTEKLYIQSWICLLKEKQRNNREKGGNMKQGQIL